MTQALYNKWRPQTWDEIIGQEHVVQTLRNAVALNRVVNAYLFAGPRGTGKTTAARILAKAVNCEDENLENRPCNVCDPCKGVNEGRFLDLIEIDAASQTGVEDVRSLRDKINFKPNQGRSKVYIIDEVHMFSTSAFNALLKTLEEPPPHAMFILATTEMHKIPATVLSRCQRFEFRRLSVNEMLSQIQKIAEKENIHAEQAALELMVRQSAGGMRDAISLLDQMASTGKEITLAFTQTLLGTATSQTVLDLVEAVARRKSAEGMNAIHAALDSGTDVRALARQVVDYLRRMLLIQMGNASQADLPAEARDQAARHAREFSMAEVLHMMKVFNAAAQDQRSGWQPALPLELALADVLSQPEGLHPMATPEPPAGNPAPQAGKKPAPGMPAPRVVEKPPAKITLPREVDPPRKSAPKEMEGKVTFDQVSRVWKQVKESLRSHPALVALLNSAWLVEIKDGVLVLGFASEVVQGKMEVPAQLEITRKAIAKAAGADLPLRCVVVRGKQAPVDVQAGGMVATALGKGGEIVDIQE